MEKIAEKIYKDRKFYNISQAQLCEGICTTSYLSSLENNKIAPNPLVTNLLLERLNQLKDKLEIIDYNIKNEDIGKIIYEERIKSGIRQDELCHNICSTAYLSKIENKKIIPTSHITNLLYKRLDEIKNNNYCVLNEEIQIEKLYDKLLYYIAKNELKRAEKILNTGLQKTENKYPKMYYLFSLQKYQNFHREFYRRFLETKAIPFFKEIDDTKILGVLYIELARYYEEANNFKLSCEYYNKGLSCIKINTKLSLSKLHNLQVPLKQRKPLKMKINQPLDTLTNKELEILNGLAKGYSNQELSENLGLSHNTVKNHISNILTKLDVKDRLNAVLKALSYGWIKIPYQ
ncbi:response regulator transcription factor [Bacillus thuringiensis]|uniref:response regulator transcription factor n=1 Tax=Bacillus thuringiensis TaxID=1428 RepID=UPI000BFCFDB7|nr:response regulator transcription factor [Bacillus thuringiensis]PGN24277.1 XRE family transcriptional regulator [Bacillus thuringiensis]